MTLSERDIRIGKLKTWSQKQTPFPIGFVPKNRALLLAQTYQKKSRDDLEEKKIPVSLGGRIVAKRHFGKAAFLKLQDSTGMIQLFFEKKTLGEENFSIYKERLDIGDIIGVEGTLFRTKTQELTVRVQKFSLLVKSLRGLPEKFHGLTDVEIRYRKRYLDLIMNPKVKETFQKRFQIIQEIRNFFMKRNFLEVETPMMHHIAGGAMARPFQTHHHALDRTLYLRIAPELYLKRLIVGGFERVFELNRNFRNEGISTQHNPEFTMLEFYQAYASLEDLIDLTETLFEALAQKILGKTDLIYQGEKISFKKPWVCLGVEEAILKHSGFNEKAALRDPEKLLHYIHSKHYPLQGHEKTGELLFLIFEEEVEKKLIQPTFLTQFPVDVSPLSRRNDQDPFLVDRFELYIYGREIANAFHELNDPLDQKARFEAQVEAKAKGNQEACEMDEDFLEALEIGMPPTSGEGIGIDRLVMLFTDAASIRDVILFPQLRNVISLKTP